MSTVSVRNPKPFKHDCRTVGYGGGTPYFYYKPLGGVVDGIGRMHIGLYFKCDVCGKEVRVGNTHVMEYGKLYGLGDK